MYAPIPMVPGPVTLHPDVIAAMSCDYGSGQIEGDFLPLYHATGRNLAKLLGTENDVVLMTGEGMLAEQGALAFELWTGQTAPRDVFYAKLHDFLQESGPG